MEGISRALLNYPEIAGQQLERLPRAAEPPVEGEHDEDEQDGEGDASDGDRETTLLGKEIAARYRDSQNSPPQILPEHTRQPRHAPARHVHHGRESVCASRCDWAFPTGHVA